VSNIPSDLQYTKSHEWVRQVQNGAVEIGITDHAQSALGDLVFVEVPDVGRALVVESVKAASDVYSPLAGKVTSSNGTLASQPELLNQDPYGAGWLFRLQTGTRADSSALLSAAAYASFLADESK
jgi:glycine cleavage system H protein